MRRRGEGLSIVLVPAIRPHTTGGRRSAFGDRGEKRMLGIYILAAMLGGGLLLFSVISGAFHGIGDVDATGADISGVDADISGVDADVSGG